MSDTTTTTTTKKWYTSKTMWVNIVSGVAAILGVFGFGDFLDAEIQASLVAAILAVVNVVNLILRAVTNTAVTRMLPFGFVLAAPLLMGACTLPGGIEVPNPFEEGCAAIDGDYDPKNGNCDSRWPFE